MAYRFRKNEAIPASIRRIVVGEIDWAVGHLTQPRNREEAIHEARKSVKKIRAVLRLGKRELRPVYRSEDRCFRDIGRQLSALRDAQAIIETFDQLIEKSSKPARFDEIRRNLDQYKRETERSLKGRRIVSATVEVLQSARERVPAWPLVSAGFNVLAPGFEASYRRGRKALAKVERDPSVVTFHEFRKGVKEHWYHLRLLEGLWTAGVKQRAAELKKLETWLGDDHNLAVLKQRVGGNVETRADREVMKEFDELASKEAHDLQAHGLEMGRRLYAEKPRVFVASLAGLWEAWQQPAVPKRPVRSAFRVKASATVA